MVACSAPRRPSAAPRAVRRLLIALALFALASSCSCANVFIDLGAFTGDSISEFFSAYSVLAAGFPAQPPSPHLFNIVAFEINPSAADRIPQVAEQNQFHGNLTIVRAAAAHVNGSLCLAYDTRGVEVERTFAQRAVSAAELQDGAGGGVCDEVPAIDFSSWLRASVSHDDFVMCKVDIESSEYALLMKMILDDTICLCDRISVEWHGSVVSNDGNPASPARALAAQGAGHSLLFGNILLPLHYVLVPDLLALAWSGCRHPFPPERWFYSLNH